jgi:predicted  nucleic acid-binding Zn-ribbon protein
MSSDQIVYKFLLNDREKLVKLLNDSPFLNLKTYLNSNQISVVEFTKQENIGDPKPLLLGFLQTKFRNWLENLINCYDYGLNGNPVSHPGKFLAHEIDCDNILFYLTNLIMLGFEEYSPIKDKVKEIIKNDFVTVESSANIISDFYSLFQSTIKKLNSNLKKTTIHVPQQLDQNAFLSIDFEYRKIIIDFFEYLKTNASWAFDYLCLHGSISTEDYVKGCSDFDTFAIIKEEVGRSSEKILELRKIMLQAWKYFFKIDPFQHHGLMIITSYDTRFYAQHFFPLVLLDFSKTIFSSQNYLLFFERESKFEELTIIHQILFSFMSSFKEEFNSLTIHQLKLRLQVLLLLPSIYYMINNNYTYKRDSLTLIYKEFDDIVLSPITKCSLIRKKNLYGKPKFDLSSDDDWLLNYHKNILSQPPPAELSNYLGDSFIEEIQNLSFHFLARLTAILFSKSYTYLHDFFHWSDQPKQYSQADYENTLLSISEKLSKNFLNIRILQQGEISSLGISDIDLVIEVHDQSNLDQLQDFWSSLDDNERYLCNHLPFFIPKNFLTSISEIWPVSNLTYVTPKSDNCVIKTPSWKEHVFTLPEIYLFINILNDFFLTFQTKTVDIRKILSRLKSLTYSIKILEANDIHVTSSKKYVQSVTDLRNSWFSTEHKSRDLKLLNLYLTYFELNLDIIVNLVSKIKTELSYDGMLHNNILGSLFDQIIFLKHWNPELFRDHVTNQVEHAKNFLIPLPKEFLFILLFYVSQKNLFGKYIEENLIHNLDPSKLSCSIILQRRATLYDKIISKLQDYRIQKIILPTFTMGNLSMTYDSFRHNLLCLSLNPKIEFLSKIEYDYDKMHSAALFNQNLLHEKDTQIQKINLEKYKIADSLATLQHNLSDKESQLATLQHNLSDKESQLATLQHNLSDKESQLATLQHEINSLRMAIEGYQKTITEIHQSFVFRALHKYDKTIGKIIPLRPKKYVGTSKYQLKKNNKNNSVKLIQKTKCFKKDIICFPIINWDFRYQRSQHLLSKFAENGHRVFYLNVNLNKLDSLYSITRIKDNIYQLDLNSPKFFDIYKDRFNGSMISSILQSFEKAKNDLDIDAISFVQFPTWTPLVKKLKQKHNFGIVFDCLDDFTGFSNVIKEREKEEKLLIQNSDLVIATSSYLLKKIMKYSSKTLLLPNAGEFAHFSHSSENLLQDYKKPIIGYFGAIADWFDTKLVEYLAEKRPNYTFVLIGHTFGSDIRKLQKFSNVHFLGERPYSELPKYLHGFDVCLIPFVNSPLIEATHPVKIYEYMSAGKPTVSTRLTELLPMSDLCYIANTKEEFLEKVDAALNEKNQDIVKKRMEFAAKNTWQHRFDTLYSKLQKIKSIDIDSHN